MSSFLAITLLALTLNLFSFSSILGNIDLQAEVTSGFSDEIFKDLSTYEFVTPHIHRDGRWRREINTLLTNVGRHRDRVELKIYSPGRKKSYILELELNRELLPSHSKTSHFDKNGKIVVTPLQESDHCYYQGLVKGLPHSSAAISTCGGIEGYINDGEETFYVQPVQSNSEQGGQFQHILYNMKDLKKKEHTCGLGHTMDSSDPKQVFYNPLHQHRRVRRNVIKESKYVELVIVNDNRQYIALKRNLKDTENRAKQIANFADSLYRPLNIRIAIVHIITWNDQDKITMNPNSDILLDNFLKYAQGDMRPVLKKAGIKTIDNAMLLSRLDFQGSTVGKAYLSVMCSDKSTGIIEDHSRNAAFTASTLAHEMGHNFGLGHDDRIAGCKCNDTAVNCIMHSTSSGFKPMSTWSSCSVKTLNENIVKGMDVCLFNQPGKLYGDPVCGNGFTEPGEECDCGTAEECRKYSAGCCNATTCKLNSGAECDEGACCKSCKFVSSGVQCREKLNECDLPEYCTGKTNQCPENVYVQNGKVCGNGKGYCYNGICPIHDEQCKSFWGKDAVSGPFFCYRPNINGDAYGNCNEFADGTFQKCKLEDVMCGSLHCTSGVPGKELPRRPIVSNTGWRTSFRTFPRDPHNVRCSKISISTSDDSPNPGKTREGTKCGEKRLCKDSKCIHLDELSWLLPLCPKNCSDNGVCTNKGYCVCNSLWTGPDCATAITCPPGSTCTTKDTTVKPSTHITTIKRSTHIMNTNAPNTIPSSTTQPKTVQTSEKELTLAPFGTKSTALTPTNKPVPGLPNTEIPPPTTKGVNVEARNEGENSGTHTTLIAAVVPTIIFIILVAIVVVFLWKRGYRPPRTWNFGNMKSDKKNRHHSLTRNAETPAQATPYLSKGRSERPRTPTSPTNLGFDAGDGVGPPTTNFSAKPAKHPSRPAPTPPVVPVAQRAAPFQKPAQTIGDNVSSFQQSPPPKPVFPVSVPIKPVIPHENQSKPLQPNNRQMPLPPPPHPLMNKKPDNQVQSQLPSQPLGQNPANKELKRSQLPVNPPSHPFPKKKQVGGSNPGQTEFSTKSNNSKPHLPTKPPPHPFLKKSTNPGQEQESLYVNTDESKKPVKPVRPPPMPKSKLNNQEIPEWKTQVQQGNSSSGDKAANGSPPSIQNKPLLPPTKPKFSPTPLPRNRSDTPPENDVTGIKPSNPFKLPKPQIGEKPVLQKDTVESNEPKKPLKYPIPPPKKPSVDPTAVKAAPLQPPQLPKPSVEPRPSPAPKPPSAPVPAKKTAGGKVPLPLPPGAKLR